MNLPTKITFSRIVATVLLIVGLFVLSLLNLNIEPLGNTGINPVFLGIFVFFVIAAFTDFLDGQIARRCNMVTDLGKFLDPVADKLLVNSMVIFLTMPVSYASGQMTFSIWCAIILVARDIVVDALRFIAAQKGIVIAANIFGKLKTVLEMVAIGVVLLNDWPFRYLYPSLTNQAINVSSFIVYAATFVSVISGIIYVIQNKKVFSSKENNSHNKESLSNLLKEKNLTLGASESFTGGLFASEMVSVPGASSIFKGSLVTYATEEKVNVLKVDEKIVNEYGVVSHETAKAMAKNTKELLNVDVAISFTGNAGPDAMENKPAGEVYVGIAYKDLVESFKFNINGNRNNVRHEAIVKAYQIINDTILKNF